MPGGASWVASTPRNSWLLARRGSSLDRSHGCYVHLDMIDAVIDRIQALDHDREHLALTEHVGVTSPIALELLAYEKLTSLGHEARYVAGVQLRVVHELAHKLRWLERVSMNPRLEPGIRVALAGLLRSLCAESDMLPVINSEATVLLEPAVLFHALLSRLRPWVPPMVLAFEPDLVIEMLQLGIPDYLNPLLRQRFEDLWELFHHLRQLPPPRLAMALNQQGFDDNWLRGLTQAALASELPFPPAPQWTAPRWASSPWIGCGNSRTKPASNVKGSKRTG